MDTSLKSHLPRLAPEYYEGRAYVHWTLTLDAHGHGWLTDNFHHQWERLLLHTTSRFDLVSPVYVLMPDHMHVLLLGLDEHGSKQCLAVEFLRRHVRRHLRSAEWQRQPYDGVLREQDRKQGAVATITRYILENPVRAGIVKRWQDYPYFGYSIPGYPDLNLQSDEYWELFWRIYVRLIR